MLTKDQEYAVRQMLGNAEDNLYRAKCAGRNPNVDPTKQWGQSGETLEQIIAGYQREVDRWKAALT